MEHVVVALEPVVARCQGIRGAAARPALSTGYGQKFVQRGWGRWGKEPFTDLMTITDAAAALPQIDETRTAAMGGSFGGYMANWIAGHTDRFDAIVSHASLWALDQFGPTTDVAYYWQREMSPEMAVENSPHLFVADIVTRCWSSTVTRTTVSRSVKAFGSGTNCSANREFLLTTRERPTIGCCTSRPRTTGS